MPTPPPPASGAEVDTFTISDLLVPADGKVDVQVDTFANKKSANDVTVINKSTAPISVLTIEKFGDNDKQQDVIRVDLADFSDNFTLVLKNTGKNVQDQLYLEGLQTFTDNGDGTYTATYFGSDSALYTVQIQPENAAVTPYYAPDGLVTGEDSAEVMGPGYTDLQGDEIDGADGLDDIIIGNGGRDTINGGDGNDTIYGDFQAITGWRSTDLPDNTYDGTPPGPDADAEVFAFSINDGNLDVKGIVTLKVDAITPNEKFAQDFAITDDALTESLNEIRIEKGGDGDRSVDVYRFDLNGFDDDFFVELLNEDQFDRLVFEGVHSVTDNLDGTFDLTYVGSDSELHIVTVSPDTANIDLYLSPDSPYFFDDEIDAGIGNDVVDAGYGDDTVWGGDGADTIDGGDGNDTIDGGAGDDVIQGDRSVPGQPLSETLLYSYAQDSTGNQAAHFGEQGLGTSNDPLLFIDGDENTEVRYHDGDIIEYAFGQELTAGTSITLIEGDNGVEDAWVDVYVSFGSTDPNGDALSGSGGGVGYENAVTNGQSVLVYSGPSDSTVDIEIPIDATHIQFVGVGSHGGWAEIEYTELVNAPEPGDDIITGGAGNDIISGEGGDDTIDGGADNDTIDGGTGNDEVIGGDGNDTLYGGDAAPDIPLERVAFEWSAIPDPDDGSAIDDNDYIITGTQAVSGVDVRYQINNSNVTFGTELVYTDGIDAGTGAVNQNSSASLDATSNTQLSFSEPVTNVEFRVNDLEAGAETLTIRAYDADGNLIPFTATQGSFVTGSDTDAVAGNDTFEGQVDPVGDASEAGSVLIQISGPVSRVEIDMVDNTGSLTVTDVSFDDPATGIPGSGDDSIDGGTGDDVIMAGLGTDTITGGSGTDTYDASASTDLANETISVTVDGLGDGTSTKANDGTTDSFTGIETFVAGEAASENDSITITDAVQAAQVTGFSDSTRGVFTPGHTVTGPIAFGGAGEPTINELLSGTYIHPTAGRVSPVGDYQTSSGEEDGATVGATSFSNFENINFDVICFTRGTRILTARGALEIENLREGDLVQTFDCGFQPICWIGSTLVPGQGKNTPIEIRSGALGNSRTLRVSPQHRMLLQDVRLNLLYAESEALAPAKYLVDGVNIRAAECPEVEYFHMMFDAHQIVFAEGIPSESFYPGGVGLGAMADDTRDEIFRLFPELRNDPTMFGSTARTVLKNHEVAFLNALAA